MISQVNKHIYQAASEKWGDALQKIVAMEEAAELIKAISKSLRSGENDNLLEEFADVLIMLEQLYSSFGESERTQLKEHYDKKIEKLKSLLVS